MLGRFISADTVVPSPGDPQSLNRYAYVQNNPLKYRDPSGHWVETALDVAGIIWDVHDLKQQGLNFWTGAALAVDVACLVVPIATGGGVAVRAVAHGDDVARVAAHADDVADVVRLANRIDDANDALAGARRLRGLDTASDEAHYLARTLADHYTQGAGSRVVLGKWVDGGGYVAEAMRNGGIFYETAPEFFEAIGKSDDLAWLVNEQFLRNQLGSGIETIELFDTTVDAVLAAPNSFLKREVVFLLENAKTYGYTLVEGCKWVKITP